MSSYLDLGISTLAGTSFSVTGPSELIAVLKGIQTLRKLREETREICVFQQVLVLRFQSQRVRSSEACSGVWTSAGDLRFFCSYFMFCLFLKETA